MRHVAIIAAVLASLPPAASSAQHAIVETSWKGTSTWAHPELQLHIKYELGRPILLVSSDRYLWKEDSRVRVQLTFDSDVPVTARWTVLPFLQTSQFATRQARVARAPRKQTNKLIARMLESRHAEVRVLGTQGETVPTLRVDMSAFKLALRRCCPDTYLTLIQNAAR